MAEACPHFLVWRERLSLLNGSVMPPEKGRAHDSMDWMTVLSHPGREEHTILSHIAWDDSVEPPYGEEHTVPPQDDSVTPPYGEEHTVSRDEKELVTPPCRA